MYLPTFNKLKFERGGSLFKRFASWGVPAGLWGKNNNKIINIKNITNIINRCLVNVPISLQCILY
jgi:hypothetical protein